MSTTIIGTAYFPSTFEAARYYRPYGWSTTEVCRKIDDGEIHIGTPPVKDDEQAVLVDERPGKRWHLKIKEPTDWREALAFLDDDAQDQWTTIKDYDLTVRLLLAMLSQANFADTEEAQPWQLHNDATGGPAGHDRCGVYGAIDHALRLLGAGDVVDAMAKSGSTVTSPGALERRCCPRTQPPLDQPARRV